MSRDSELDQNLSGDFQKNFYSDRNEIWYVGRGRWVMHDGMPYGRNQGQGQGKSTVSPPRDLILFTTIFLTSKFHSSRVQSFAMLNWYPDHNITDELFESLEFF